MIPNLFWKVMIPNKLPESMQDIVTQLKKSENKEVCLRKAYNILSKKYRGCRFYTYLKFFDLFITDVNRLWKKNGCLHCTHLNYLLRVLLIKSGFFKEEDIKLKLTLIYYVSIHQYLNIRINNDKFIDVDLWGNANGIKFGYYTHGFYKSK